MRITIGDFTAVDRSCGVKFTEGEIVHKRRMNAVLDDDGNYDKAATKVRAVDVGVGVAQKIALGVIVADGN